MGFSRANFATLLIVLFAAAGAALKAGLVREFAGQASTLSNQDGSDRQRAVTTPDESQFLKKHWQLPVPLQGKPPAGFSELESSLAASDCGVCHRQQYDDWRTTVHSKSVGPGLLGQTPGFLSNDPQTAIMCYTCHAPLTEQEEVHETESGLVRNPYFNATLQHDGLTCAGCHVRQYQRFGPPGQAGGLAGSSPRDQLPHNGATLTTAFERSEFCAGCHQFEKGDKSLNGKLLENTYNEWKNGPYAARGIQCQQCHMPEGRHLWRGIHDPEMVKRGVSVRLSLNREHYGIGQNLEASLTVTNAGVGHDFPSYVTPKVVAQFELRDKSGKVIPGSGKEAIIGWEVTLDISKELFDTRIPPKGSRTFHYRRRLDQKGLTFHVSVTVQPDDFYRRFYEAKLAGHLTGEERRLLTQALQHSQQSSYKIFERDLPLP